MVALRLREISTAGRRARKCRASGSWCIRGTTGSPLRQTVGEPPIEPLLRNRVPRSCGRRVPRRQDDPLHSTEQVCSAATGSWRSSALPGSRTRRSRQTTWHRRAVIVVDRRRGRLKHKHSRVSCPSLLSSNRCRDSFTSAADASPTSFPLCREQEHLSSRWRGTRRTGAGFPSLAPLSAKRKRAWELAALGRGLTAHKAVFTPLALPRLHQGLALRTAAGHVCVHPG